MKTPSEIFSKAFTAYKIVKGLYYEGNDVYTNRNGKKVWFGTSGLLHEDDNPLCSLIGFREFDAFAAGYLSGWEYLLLGDIKPLYRYVVTRFSGRLKKAFEVGEVARKVGFLEARDKMNDIKRFDRPESD